MIGEVLVCVIFCLGIELENVEGLCVLVVRGVVGRWFIRVPFFMISSSLAMPVYLK